MTTTARRPTDDFQRCPLCVKKLARIYSPKDVRERYADPAKSHPLPDHADIRWFRCERCKRPVYFGPDLVLRKHGAEAELRHTPSRKFARADTDADKSNADTRSSTRVETVAEDGGDTVSEDRPQRETTIADQVEDLVKRQSLLVDRYQLLRVLGAGNAGIVVLAKDTYQQTETMVAAKFHLETADISAHGNIPRQRVVRVHELQGTLNSPHALKSLALIRPDGDAREGPPCYVTVEEYVNGDPLGRVIKEHKALMRQLQEGKKMLAECPIELVTEESAVAIGVQIAGLLAHAYRRGRIVHRDIKPDNIMIKQDDAHPSGIRAILIDWGIARSNRNARRDTRALFDHELSLMRAEKLSQTLTLAGTVLGTPHYMSPEQAVADRPTHLTDLYCLAATLYHVVTGSPALDADNVADLLKFIILKDPQRAGIRAKTLGLTVSEAFSDVLAKAMQKDPARRYQSADEFAEALKASRHAPVQPEVKPPTTSNGGGLLSRFFG